MSLWLPQRSAVSRGGARRLGLPAALGLGVLLMSGCSSEARRLAMPEPVTEQGEHTLDLWQGAWIAALVTGVVVWGLIFWVVVRYRRRSDDEIPVQTRYNLPLEIFYTVAPIMMVIVFFAQTVRVQNIVLDEDTPPDQTIGVVGFQWSWAFNYALDDENGDGVSETDRYVWEAGTAGYIPTLYVPEGSTTRFELSSPDVIHDFGVPGFLIKMDVIPGRDNSFQVTPKRLGEFAGKCYELCGTYHSRMLFNVQVVPQEEYDAYLQTLVDAGRETDAPITGGEFVRTQAGAPTDETEGAAE